MNGLIQYVLGALSGVQGLKLLRPLAETRVVEKFHLHRTTECRRMENEHRTPLNVGRAFNGGCASTVPSDGSNLKRCECFLKDCVGIKARRDFRPCLSFCLPHHDALAVSHTLEWVFAAIAVTLASTASIANTSPSPVKDRLQDKR